MEPQKLPQQVIDQIKTIQQNNQLIQNELGQIELEKLILKQRRVAAEQFLQDIQQEESTLGQFIQTTYGRGAIDIDKGEFISLT